MITIVTDSTAYLTRNQAAELGLGVVPMQYFAGGQQFLESYSDCNGSFLSLLSAKSSATAQVPVSAFASAFEEVTRKGGQVFCLVISSRLSGAYRSASLAARQVNRNGKGSVLVVDSQTTAGGLFLLCKQAAQLAETGISLQELADKTEELRAKVGVVFSLDSMDALRKSGRIGIVRQSVGSILNRRPILQCQDGAVISQGTATGKVQLRQKLLSCIPDQPKELVVNMLSPSSTDAAQLEQELRHRFPDVPITKNQVGPVLGIHLGKGVLGVSWIV